MKFTFYRLRFLILPFFVFVIACSKKEATPEPQITEGDYYGNVVDGSSSIDFFNFGLPVSLVNAKIVILPATNGGSTSGNNTEFTVNVINDNTGKALLKNVIFTKNGSSFNANYQKIRSDYNTRDTVFFELLAKGSIIGKTININFQAENIANGGILEDIYIINATKR